MFDHGAQGTPPGFGNRLNYILGLNINSCFNEILRKYDAINRPANGCQIRWSGKNLGWIN